MSTPLPAASHLYPSALAAEVVARWSQLDPPGSPLPPAEVLERLFDVLYQASLLTEESRRVRCRVMLATPEAWPSCEGPPTGFHVLCFAEPHLLEPQALRKLALAAAYYRGLLGVRVAPDGSLEIWGMVNSGARWVSRTDGGRYQGVPLPRHLVTHVTGPGSLRVYCGYEAVLTAPGPGVSLAGADPFLSVWMSHHFRAVRTALRERFAVERVDGVDVEDGFVRQLGQNVLRRILSLVRDGGHGGMILFLPEAWAAREDSPVVLEGHLRFAPGQSTGRFRALMLDAMTALSEAAATGNGGREVAGWSEYQDLGDPRLAEVDEALFEMAHLLADLMAVDGALVMSNDWNLLGFGAEVRSQVGLEFVHRALDPEGEEKARERPDRAGTRHRAAYRFAATVPEGLAIVISQDATVRFVTQQRGEVTYWDYAP